MKTASGKIAIATAIPINSRGHIKGLVVLLKYYTALLPKMKKVINNDVALYPIHSTKPDASTHHRFFSLVKAGNTLTDTSIEFNNKVYETVGLKIKGFNQKPIANLVAAMDNTKAVKAEHKSLWVGALIVVAWLLIFSIIIFKVASHNFKPIENMIAVSRKIDETGDMSLRIPVASQDEVGQAATAVNNTLAKVGTSIEEVNKVLACVARGDFSPRLNLNAQGDFATLETELNKSVDSLENTMQAIVKVTQGMSAGDFTVRMDPNVAGEVRHSVDNAMVAMSSAIDEVNKALGYMAKGDFSYQISLQSQGDLASLISSVNSRVEQTAKALDEILGVVSALAEGDLTHTVTAHYEGKFGEVAQGLNTSLQNLSQLISNTRGGVQNVSNNVDQIYNGVLDLNDRTQRQAAALEETTATMQNITEGVKNTSDNAQAANQLAGSARKEADRGAEIMRSTIESMGNIREASHKIEDIITLIDSIAFQTNLLALNAAVEAARAGEHGRGFAVVAGEVRNLAGKSADAARDIKGLIENAVEAVDEGTERAEKSDAALQSITQSIRQVGDLVAEITAATNEQSSSIAQIGQAVSDIDQVTQQNAALVEETTAASETMRDETTEVTKLVGQFKV